MKRNLGRILALVLMLIMVCGSIPVSANSLTLQQMEVDGKCYNPQSAVKPGGSLIGADFYGDYMYVPFRSNSNGGFYVYDISKPTSISQKAKIEITGWKGPVDGIKPILVDGDYLYIGFNDKGYINKYYLKGTPENPQYICTYDTTTDTNSYGVNACSYIEKVNGKLVIAKTATEVWAFDDTVTTVFTGDANANLVKVTNLTQVNGTSSYARYGNHNIIEVYGDYVYTLGKNNGLAAAFKTSDFTYTDYHAYRSKSPEFYDMAISASGIAYVLATDECNSAQNTAANSTAHNVKLKAIDLTPTTSGGKTIAQCQNWIKDGAPTYLFEDTSRVITTKADGTTRITSMAISNDGKRLAILNATDGDKNDNANGDGTGNDLDVIYMYDISTSATPVFMNTIDVPNCDFVTFDSDGNMYCTGMSSATVFSVALVDNYTYSDADMIKSTPVTLGGTCAEGATVTVTIGDQNYPATVNGTSWSVTISDEILGKQTVKVSDGASEITKDYIFPGIVTSVTTYPAGDSTIAKAVITNNTDDPVDVMLVAAAYSGTALKDVTVADKTIGAKTSVTEDIPLSTLDTTGANKIVVFTWDKTSLTPLGAAPVKPITANAE